jgi:hypothetical protein
VNRRAGDHRRRELRHAVQQLLVLVAGGVAPGRLDPRAPPMMLSGPLQLRLAGVRSPDPAAAAPTGAPSLGWQFDLTGLIDGMSQPVRLSSRGEADDRRLDIERLRADEECASIQRQLEQALAAARTEAAANERAVHGRDELLSLDVAQPPSASAPAISPRSTCC